MANELIHWHLEVLGINTLKPHEKNPRQMSKQNAIKLEEGIKKFGMIDKPIVNKDWTIIGGHQRIRLLKKMKQKTVECWVPDRQLEDKELDELCISLNLHQGQWDWDCLANSWEVLDLLEFGFTEEQLIGIGADIEEIEDGEKKSGNKKKKSCPNCGHEF